MLATLWQKLDNQKASTRMGISDQVHVAVTVEKVRHLTMEQLALVWRNFFHTLLQIFQLLQDYLIVIKKIQHPKGGIEQLKVFVQIAQRLLVNKMSTLWRSSFTPTRITKQFFANCQGLLIVNFCLILQLFVLLEQFILTVFA